MSFTLFRYIAWRLTASIGALFLAFTLLIMVIDLIENMRFAGKYADGSMFIALQLTFLRALGLSQALSPFLFLFGSLWCFSQLNRRSEISVMRSAGLSIWKILTPAVLVSLFIGIILTTVIDPLSSKMMAYSEHIQNVREGKQTSLVQFFRDGVWLRQNRQNGSLIINAKNINTNHGLLSNLTVWRISPEAEFVERIDAPHAKIVNNAIIMATAISKKISEPTHTQLTDYRLETNLSLKDLSEQVAKPETLSIWNVRHFIRLAQTAGVPTSAYYLRLHDLISTPLKLLGMVLIAATFSIRPGRRGGIFALAVLAITVGFSLYVITEISTALGEAGNVPIVLAAWGPAIIATLFAITGLLHLEDG